MCRKVDSQTHAITIISMQGHKTEHSRHHNLPKPTVFQQQCQISISLLNPWDPC